MNERFCDLDNGSVLRNTDPNYLSGGWNLFVALARYRRPET
jgi:hypothetical protein